MAVKDLQARQGNVDIMLEIVEKAAIREFEKFGKKGRVCNCKGKDDTGTVSITLWNEDIDSVKVGDKVHIQNGWVSEWQGELQLSTGKFGKIEVVGSDAAETVDEALEAELADNPPSSDTGEHIMSDDEREEMEIMDELKRDLGPEGTATDDKEDMVKMEDIK